ncbi:hypothetical protein FB451DRAFT_1185948 [Mycena latifolia]|nr:hypothetical protein FB451DRAFT_1185948 [Mycena latifolia]
MYKTGRRRVEVGLPPCAIDASTASCSVHDLEQGINGTGTLTPRLQVVGFQTSAQPFDVCQSVCRVLDSLKAKPKHLTILRYRFYIMQVRIEAVAAAEASKVRNRKPNGSMVKFTRWKVFPTVQRSGTKRDICTPSILVLPQSASSIFCGRISVGNSLSISSSILRFTGSILDEGRTGAVPMSFCNGTVESAGAVCGSRSTGSGDSEADRKRNH